jgi:hypothetical protein
MLGYPGPVGTWRSLEVAASFAGAAAAEVERVLLRLLARLGVEDFLSDANPAVVADVGNPVGASFAVLAVGRWVWFQGTCGRVIHVNLLSGWPGSGSGELRGAISMSERIVAWS